MQVKYVKKIYEIKLNEIDYVNKVNELRKLAEVYENVFDTHDVVNVRCGMKVKSKKIKS